MASCARLHLLVELQVELLLRRDEAHLEAGVDERAGRAADFVSPRVLLATRRISRRRAKSSSVSPALAVNGSIESPTVACSTKKDG